MHLAERSGETKSKRAGPQRGVVACSVDVILHKQTHTHYHHYQILHPAFSLPSSIGWLLPHLIKKKPNMDIDGVCSVRLLDACVHRARFGSAFGCWVTSSERVFLTSGKFEKAEVNHLASTTDIVFVRTYVPAFVYDEEDQEDQDKGLARCAHVPATRVAHAASQHTESVAINGSQALHRKTTS